MNEADFAAAVRRIRRSMAWLAGCGTLAALVWGGWPSAGGFAAGGAASYLSFHWLKRLVDALGATNAGKPPRGRVAVFLGLRYLLLGVGGYAILKSSVVSLPAALAGLFVAVAAVILEILFELLYARI